MLRRIFGSDFGEASERVRRSFGAEFGEASKGDFGEASEVTSARFRSEFGEASECPSRLPYFRAKGEFSPIDG